MNPSEYVASVQAVHNHVCILNGCELGRVVGIHFDADDVYYRVRAKSYAGQDPVETIESMVGGCTSLEGIYDHYPFMEKLFAMNGSPTTSVLTVSAESRETFGRMRGDEGLAYYDEDIAPLLATSVSPEAEAAQRKEAFEAIRASFPQHLQTILRSAWIGATDGVDVFRHPWSGNLIHFDRTQNFVWDPADPAANIAADVVFARYIHG